MAKEWRVIPLKSYSIYEMHSLEDAIRKSVKRGNSPPTVMFAYIDPPAVSISRRQNLYKDVDVELCERTGIHIARRDRSGRSVYFDRNYLIVSVIGKNSDLALRTSNVRDMFAFFTKMVTYSLHEILGKVVLANRGNDLIVNDKKIGGVAAHQTDGVTVVHGFFRYEKSWELPLQLLKIDNYPLSPYISRVNEITTSVREFRDVGYFDFYEQFMRHFLMGIKYRMDDASEEEIRLARNYVSEHTNKKWIRGSGKEDSRGHCDIIEGTKLKIPELEGLVNFV